METILTVAQQQEARSLVPFGLLGFTFGPDDDPWRFVAELFRYQIDQGYGYLWRVLDKEVVRHSDPNANVWEAWHAERWGQWYDLAGKSTAALAETDRTANPLIPEAVYYKVLLPSWKRLRKIVLASSGSPPIDA